MIRPYTRVRCADNTGARELSVIRVLASSTGTTAEIGDVFIAAVKNAIPNSGVKKGEVVRAVVVRQTKEYRRTDGSYIRFDDNAAVLLNPQNQPRGTRIFGPVARELRERNFMKIVSRGRVQEVRPRDLTVIVAGLNIAKHHTKANPAKNQKGGIIEQPMPLGLGKVMVICPHCGKPTRVAHRSDEETKERVCKRCGEAIVVEEPK